MLAKVAAKLKDETLRDAALTFGIRVGSAGLAYGIQVFLARALELQEYGIYAALWTFTIVAAHVAVAGFSESSLRFIPRYMARGRPACAKGFLNTGFKMTAAGSVLLVLLGLGVLWLAGPQIPAIYLAALLVVVLGLPLATMELYLEGVCRSFGWFALAIVPGYLIRPLLIGLAVVLWSLSGGAPDAAFVLAVALILTGLLALFQAVIVYRRLAAETGPVRGTNRTRLWLRASLPLILVASLEEIFISTDILLLTLIGEPQEVAMYFAAVRSMAIVNFVFYALHDRQPAQVLHRKRRPGPRQAAGDHYRNQQLDHLADGPRGGDHPRGRVSAPAPVRAGVHRRLPGHGSDRAWISRAGLGRSGGGTARGPRIPTGQPRGQCGRRSEVNVVFTLALYPLMGIAGVAAATALSLAFRAAATAYVARRYAELNVFVTGWPGGRTRPAGRACSKQFLKQPIYK